MVLGMDVVVVLRRRVEISLRRGMVAEVGGKAMGHGVWWRRRWRRIMSGGVTHGAVAGGGRWGGIGWLAVALVVVVVGGHWEDGESIFGKKRYKTEGALGFMQLHRKGFCHFLACF